MPAHYFLSSLRPIAALCALLLSAIPAGATDFFVAPTGSDEQPGTKDLPFATIQRAQKAASPGDTVFIRGGTYVMREDHIAKTNRLHAYVTHLDKSGKPGAPIRYWAFPGEVPVFDFSGVKPTNRRVSAFYVPGSWIHLKGLDVRGVQVTMKGHTQSICFYNDGSHNIYELLSMHDGQAIGIYSVRGSENLFLNCDAYRNHDHTSEDGKGGNVDGFGAHPVPGATGNVFCGCRAWYNSDDGFDCITASEGVVFENCWAMYNGQSADGKRLADGNGFKAGGYGTTPASRLPVPIPRHTVRFCLAVGNRSSGFYANHHPGGGDWLHNSAFRNGTNFDMLGRIADNTTDIPGQGHVLKNNLSYKTRRDLSNLDAAKSQSLTNSFDLGLKLTDADFEGLDEAQLLRPRNADGSLPKIEFMRPAKGSSFVDKGTPTGTPFNGKAPDLGAFEQ